MDTISKIIAREILDSRGDPTVEVELTTSTGITTIASVPSGSSVGSHEAVELRDDDQARYSGKGVLKAIGNIKDTIGPALVGVDVTDQRKIDQTMIELDGTEHKSKLGANAILAVSVASCKAAAISKSIPLYQYISELSSASLAKMPSPMFNFIEGGKHADNNLSIQEFLAIPDLPTFTESYREASESFHRLKKMLQDNKIAISYGDEGGFGPILRDDQTAVDLISKSGKLKIGLDLAGVTPSNFNIPELITKYPIVSLEDPLNEDDWVSWTSLNQQLAGKALLIGDDLLVTNIQRLNQAIAARACTGAIVKINQIGSISETLDFISECRKNSIKVVVSHRSGETEDTFVADFAVGVQADYCKLGAPSRGERIAKYNRLIRIEEKLKND